MKIPATEQRCVSYYDGDEMRFVMTSKNIGEGYIYTLYRANGGEYERLGKGSSPLELESKFHVHDNSK